MLKNTLLFSHNQNLALNGRNHVYGKLGIPSSLGWTVVPSAHLYGGSCKTPPPTFSRNIFGP